MMFKYGPRREKPCLRGFATNKSAEEPTLMRSLISAFAIGLMERILSRHATSKNFISIAEQAGLNKTLSETPRTGFVAMRPICQLNP